MPESTTWYHSLFEQALEGIFRSTPEGRFVEVNPALVRMLGYESAEEVLALKLPDDLYVDPAQRTHLRANYEPTGVIEGVEVLWKRKNGEQIVVSLYARTLCNARGRVVGYEGMVLDVTKQKRMEEALRQSEARYRTVSDLISDYAYAVRIEPDGRPVVEWVTDAFSRLTGFTVEELEANGGIVRVIHPADLPSVLQRLSILLAGQPGISEHRIITKSGEVRWLRDYSCPDWDASQGRVVRIIGAGQDITEQKRAEEALQESEARYRNLFENANDMIATFSLDGIITNVNRGLEVALGWSREELIGQHYSKLATPSALALADARTHRALAGEELPSIFAAEIVHKDGRVVPIEVRSRFIRDTTGQPIGVQGVFRDLTERKRAEAALATLSRQVLEAQETERRHLAHELHDELGQELTALKLMLQMTKGTPQAVAQRLRNSIKVVDDLLLQVRTLSLDLRPLMLDELGLIATLDWYVQRQAQRGGCVIHFAADALEPRPHPAIETACFRVVQAALTNVARHAQACQIWVEVRHHDSALLLHVRDDGIGFDLDAARAQVAQGKGLGLVGMEERVRLVGGQMEIVTEPGRGTEIRACFPLRERL